MRITRLETYFLSIPLPQPVRTSTNTISQVSEVIVKLTTDAGHVGIGEAHGPFLFRQGPEGMRVVNDIMQQITPLVVGEDPFNSERIWQDIFALTYRSVRGIPPLARQQRQLITALSAIDIALWDLKGKAIGRPVYALLGGALRERVPAYATGFYYRDNERPDDLIREVALYMEQGYRTLKVKVGGLTPEADAERVGLIRKTAGDDVALMLDANQGWDLPTAIQAARLCEPHNIFWLEDPMPWYDERHALQRLKTATNIPLAAGETEYTPFGLRTMLVEGLVDYVIIDSTWAGGLSTWRKAATIAEMYQIPMAAHHDPQIHVHALVSSPTGFILESFADPTRDPLWFELFKERPAIVDGHMRLPEAPGLGLELRDDTLEKYGVKVG
ncbi:MAG: mandelate racemase/muconate lactonizing enzyme family protein [Candidatus Tectomicrobia bacterium]|uniref:Mandelate racemase/muconate lactonizing enzyme family protein n=1 Tax=Tectimicrobiota bacterium TaxID=2528274 RepID=A0A937W588_UNCTE|nr:mandelate racemase/muconate lactonizing enzyme family protein [Candidatus Tectomicrobia bacterium]